MAYNMQLVKYETEKNYATHPDLKGVALLDKINLNCSVGALILHFWELPSEIMPVFSACLCISYTCV